MSDFNALVEIVYGLTKRRDYVEETINAVKSATLQLHRKDFFARDLREVVLEFTTADYLQSVDIKTLFPLYRALKYSRKFDAGTSTVPPEYGMGKFFTLIPPEKVLDEYNQTRNDVCYVAGNNLNLRSSTAIKYCSVGIYQNPQVSTPETYSSWIADEIPYAIAYQAAAIIRGTLLKDTAGQRANQELAMQEMQSILIANITNEGE